MIPSLPNTSSTSVVADSGAWRIASACLGRVWEGQLIQLAASITTSFTGSSSGTPQALVDDFGPKLSDECPKDVGNGM